MNTSKLKSKKNIKKTSKGFKKSSAKQSVRDLILKALSHSEAEDGLYFRNFFLLHEEDTRPSVQASKSDLLTALNGLLEEGKVKVDYDDLEVTFRLV